MTRQRKYRTSLLLAGLVSALCVPGSPAPASADDFFPKDFAKGGGGRGGDEGQRKVRPTPTSSARRVPGVAGGDFDEGIESDDPDGDGPAPGSPGGGPSPGGGRPSGTLTDPFGQGIEPWDSDQEDGTGERLSSRRGARPGAPSPAGGGARAAARPDASDPAGREKVLALAAYMDGSSPEKLLESVRELGETAAEFDLPVREVVVVGRPEMVAGLVEQTLVSDPTGRLTFDLIQNIRPAGAPPAELGLKASPTWVLDTAKGRILLEGIASPRDHLDQKGRFTGEVPSA